MLGFSVSTQIFDVSEEKATKNLDRFLIEGVDSIEIFIHPNFFSDPNLFDKAARLDFSKFKYISLHAPAINYGTDPQTQWVLEGLSKIVSHQKISHVTVHPAGVSDWNLFKDLDAEILIENMDVVKNEGQDVDDMERYFSQLDTGMTLDLQHSYSLDASMALTDRLIETFKERIKEIHISGWEPPNHHISLYNFKDRDLIAQRLRKLPGVKVIMEGITTSDFESPQADEILRSEVEFVRQFII